METYSCWDKPDGLSGLACLPKSLSSQDQLLINKKAVNWAEVLTACEQALQMEPTSVQRHSDVLNCLLNMCHLQAMVTHVDGLISRIPKYRKTWCMQGAQAAWRLGRWDLMNEYPSGADEDGLLCNSSESNASFDLDVAKTLQAMMKEDQFSVAEKIPLSKQVLIAPLAAAGMDSYTRAYPIIVKLHLLRELEDYHSLNLSWRNHFTWAREPLLAFRRLVFGASSHGCQVGNCWLQYAKISRLAGHYETANRAILESQASGAPDVHMKKAKLLWNTRCSDGAIAELQRSLLNMPVEVDSIHWAETEGRCDESLFQVLVDARKRQEENFELGSRTLPSVSAIAASSNSNTEKYWWSYLPDVLLFYAKGLDRGHRNLFQPLPRLLTLRFVFGSIYQRSAAAYNKDLKNVQGKVTSIMRGCLKDLPMYQWLTVLPQLQALWIMAVVSKSTVPSRREAAAEIIQVAQKGFSPGNNGFVQFASLADHLIELCFLPGQPKSRTINISTEFSALKNIMPLGIIVPIQQSLIVNLPTYDANLTDHFLLISFLVWSFLQYLG
ncbi:hypothetical protein PTKIN_Ptkin02bG0254300 [Pterospermum kingtungense]